MSGPKIVQISVVPAGQFTAAFYLALCDDGTAWQLPDRADSAWEQLPPIPQPKPSAESTSSSLPEIVPDEKRGGYKAVLTLPGREA